jgi:acetylornithine deacetylase/succinyl-diaminopimelate desuccinylase-like protein
MDLDRWIERTLDVQSIPAPTFDESERAVFLRSEFEASGVNQLEQDEIGNLFARIPGADAPPVIVSAHLDTVFASQTDLSHRKTRSRLIGPGVGDNSVALAALVELAGDLQKRELAGDVWLVANVGEEGLGNLRGMREVVARFGEKVTAYIVLEGMALGHIYHRALPVRRYRITFRAEGGHSWIHAGRTSALHKLIEVGGKLLEMRIPSNPRTTLNIGRIEGGRSINSIADKAVLEIDLRSESETTLEELDKQLGNLVRGVRPGGADIELAQVGSRPGGDLEADHPLVLAALDSFNKTGERDTYLEFGSTDANVPLNRGIPAVCVGITKGGEAHTIREYIEIRPMQKGYEGVLNLIEASFSLDSRSI